MFRSIHTKLVALWLFACLTMIVMFSMALSETHERYHLKVRQELGRPMAQMLLDDSPAISAVAGEAPRWQGKLERYATINPDIGVYLVNQAGDVVAASLPISELARKTLDVSLLWQDAVSVQSALMGPDPADPSRTSAISVVSVPGGYLYVVLRNPDSVVAAQELRKSDAYWQAIWLAVCWAGMAIVGGIATVRIVTKPIQQLSNAVERFRRDNFIGDSTKSLTGLPATNDEVGKLSRAILEMSSRIASQMKEIEKNDATRRELFANISHDLRTPLTSLLGYLETVSTAENLTEEERRRYCGIAMQEAHHLSILVDDLLELAKLDVPDARISHAPFLMSELVASVATRFSLSGEERRVLLKLPSANLNQKAVGDEVLIGRVLENLLENAFRHTPPGGTIGIELDLKGDDASKQLTTTVWDSGSGISSEDLPRIFDRFYRGEKARQMTTSGAGLGLAICKRILELHDAMMLVETEPGRGSKFSFSLPIAKSQAHESEQIPSTGRGSTEDNHVPLRKTSEFA